MIYVCSVKIKKVSGSCEGKIAKEKEREQYMNLLGLSAIKSSGKTESVCLL